MDIGTAKPTPFERAEVPHHLIDIADPSEDFTVVRFRDACDRALTEIEARGNQAVLVGGTGLYVRAVVDRLEPPGEWPAIRAQLEAEPDVGVLHARLESLDPLAASRMTNTNRRRIVRALEVSLGSGKPFSSFGPGLGTYGTTGVTQVGLRMPRETLSARIRRRFDAQLAAGFVDEVAALAARDRPLSRTASQALGYRELLAHVRGDMELDEAIDLAITRTRQFAVRQERWFRRDPRIVWVDAEANPLEAVLRLLGDSSRCT